MTNSTQMDPGTPNLQNTIGYPVSSLKFWMMGIFTGGIYLLYWSYKNFRALQVPSDSKVAAVIWCIFLPLSFFSMMQGLETKASENNYPIRTHKWALAWIYFLLVTAAKFLDRMSDRVTDETLALLGFGALGCQLLSLFILSIYQRKLLVLNRELRPQAQIASRFTIWDIILMIVCVAVFIALIIFG